MEGNIWLLGAVAWPFLAAFISLLAGKKGERNRDVFASAAMVMENRVVIIHIKAAMVL